MVPPTEKTRHGVSWHTVDKPYPRSYWVVPAGLLAGYYPGALYRSELNAKLGALLDAGISTVVNLMEEDEVDWEDRPFAPYASTLIELGAQRGVAAECLRFPIRDGWVPGVEEMRATLDAIDAALGAGRRVYVHCWGGKGRTGTVVGCYLARHGLAQGDAALAMIQELRRGDVRCSEPSPESKAQCDMVRGWPAGQ
jgi:protein-tyrosine phosphatase